MNLKTVSTSPIGSARATDPSSSTVSARSSLIRSVWQEPRADGKGSHGERGRAAGVPLYAMRAFGYAPYTNARGKPMKHSLVVGCLSALVFSFEVGAADCIKDERGNVVCGKGQCAT